MHTRMACRAAIGPNVVSHDAAEQTWYADAVAYAAAALLLSWLSKDARNILLSADMTTENSVKGRLAIQLAVEARTCNRQYFCFAVMGGAGCCF